MGPSRRVCRKAPQRFSFFSQRPSESPASQRLSFSMGLPIRPGQAVQSFNPTTTQAMATCAAYLRAAEDPFHPRAVGKPRTSHPSLLRRQQGRPEHAAEVHPFQAPEVKTPGTVPDPAIHHQSSTSPGKQPLDQIDGSAPSIRTRSRRAAPEAVCICHGSPAHGSSCYEQAKAVRSGMVPAMAPCPTLPVPCRRGSRKEPP
jgi:hypothetical protein